MIYDLIALMLITLTVVGLLVPAVAGPKSKNRF
jgi:hypothetical protein